MSFGMYCRLNLHVSQSNMDVVRATRRLLNPEGHGRKYRKPRHDLYRTMLKHHKAARKLYYGNRFGG